MRFENGSPNLATSCCSPCALSSCCGWGWNASTLFSLFFFSVCKGGGHRKITIIIEDPVAGSQCRGAASCPPFHFCPPCMIHFCHFLFWLSFFQPSALLFLSCDATFLSCAIPFCSFCVVKFYTVVPWKFWILNCLCFLKSLHFLFFLTILLLIGNIQTLFVV